MTLQLCPTGLPRDQDTTPELTLPKDGPDRGGTGLSGDCPVFTYHSQQGTQASSLLGQPGVLSGHVPPPGVPSNIRSLCPLGDHTSHGAASPGGPRDWDRGSEMASWGVWVGGPSLLPSSPSPSSYNPLVPQLPELGNPVETLVVAASAEGLPEAGGTFLKDAFLPR